VVQFVARVSSGSLLFAARMEMGKLESSFAVLWMGRQILIFAAGERP
jgi:hypothetical protein